MYINNVNILRNYCELRVFYRFVTENSAIPILFLSLKVFKEYFLPFLKITQTQKQEYRFNNDLKLFSYPFVASA